MAVSSARVNSNVPGPAGFASSSSGSVECEEKSDLLPCESAGAVASAVAAAAAVVIGTLCAQAVTDPVVKEEKSVAGAYDIGMATEVEQIASCTQWPTHQAEMERSDAVGPSNDEIASRKECDVRDSAAPRVFNSVTPLPPVFYAQECGEDLHEGEAIRVIPSREILPLVGRNSGKVLTALSTAATVGETSDSSSGCLTAVHRSNSSPCLKPESGSPLAQPVAHTRLLRSTSLSCDDIVDFGSDQNSSNDVALSKTFGQAPETDEILGRTDSNQIEGGKGRLGKLGEVLTKGRSFSARRRANAALSAAAKVQEAEWRHHDMEQTSTVVSNLVETVEHGFAAFEFHREEDEENGVPEILDPADALEQWGIDEANSPMLRRNRPLHNSTGSLRSPKRVNLHSPTHSNMHGRRYSTPMGINFTLGSPSPTGSHSSIVSPQRQQSPPTLAVKRALVKEYSGNGDGLGKRASPQNVKHGQGMTILGSQQEAILPFHDADTGAQSEKLLNYLTQEMSSELDQENAHFAVCEAIISAMEQVKSYHQRIDLANGDDAEPSEVFETSEEHEEIEEQYVRFRRSAALHMPDLTDNAAGDSVASSQDSTIMSHSSHGSLPSHSSESNSQLSDWEDTVVEDQLKKRGSDLGILSLSMGTLYSPADFTDQETLKEDRSHSDPPSSAQAVARGFLDCFASVRLHAASDLQCMLQEEGLTRAILRLDDATPTEQNQVETKRAEAMLAAMSASQPRIRGNQDWAPPRFQIIFNLHPPQKRKVVLQRQKGRCAGCGMSVDPNFMKRFRYCEYLGKYFCHSCHGNQMDFIPARVLHKWDFKKYPVSNFSHNLLVRMYEEPLFQVNAINPRLLRRVKVLVICETLRRQLYYLKDFIHTCRLCKTLKEHYDKQSHWVSKPHLYSLQDLNLAHSNRLQGILASLVEEGLHHVRECQLCFAKGFVCEVCKNGSDIIFPFQLQKCYQCPVCWACFHKTCFSPRKSMCPKCQRLRSRRLASKVALPTTPPEAGDEKNIFPPAASL